MDAEAKVFYGFYIGSEGMWHNELDLNGYPDFLSDEELFWDKVSETKEPKFSSDLFKDEAENIPVTLVKEWIADEYEALALAIKVSVSHHTWNDNPVRFGDMKPDQDFSCDEWDEILYEWVDNLGIDREKISQANPDGPGWNQILNVSR